MKNLITFLMFFLIVAANVFAAPGRTTYQAKIIKPDGYPLEANNVSFQFSILDPTGTCVLYVESYAAVNMANSGGLISFALGAGTKTFPASSTAISSMFDNSTVSYSCQSPGIYNPVSSDIRKIVMQFNDGTGWQTLPAMSINAVPYAMYAGKSEDSILFNGKADSAFVQYSTMPTCAASQALHFNGATFSCITAGGGTSYTVTSSDVTSALGYTPANPATLSSSFTTTASFSTVTAAVDSLGSSVTAVTTTVGGLSASLTNLTAAVSAITSSQWTTSGTTINYTNGNVGIGTDMPIGKLHISDNIATNILLDGYFNGTSAPGLAARKARGTAASPTAVLANDYLGTFGARGYGATGFSTTTRGMIGIKASESWTDTAQGAAMTFETTANSSTTRLERMRIDQNGFVGIGTTAPAYTLDVSGTVNAKSLKINGVDIVATVTSSSVISALGYTPVDPTSLATSFSTVTTSFTTVSSNLTNLTNSMTAVTSTVNDLSASMAAVTSSQWTASGSAIHYAAGNVGIGTTNPANKLDIVGVLSVTSPSLYGALLSVNNSSTVGVGANRTLALQNLNATSGNSVDIAGLDSAGSANAGIAFQFADHLGTSGSGNILFGTRNAGTWAERMRVSAAGNMGIGTSAPTTKLDVAGGIRISMEAATCAVSFAGTLRYNTGSVEYCNGSAWLPFGVAGAGITSINGSTSGSQTFATGITGTVFNISSSNGVHTFNIPLAASGSVTAGLLSNADYVTFTNKVSATSASVISALGYTPLNDSVSGTYLVKANNLSDIASAPVARTNLGLGSLATLNFLDLGSSYASGTLSVARLPAFSGGDVSSSAGSAVLTLASVGAGVTSGAQYTKVTVDGKGRVVSGAQLSSSDVTTALGFTPVSASAATQWTTNGTQIYYSAGSVGIGTANPAATLEVVTASSDATAVQEVLRISSTGRSSGGGTPNRTAVIAFSDANNATLTGGIGGLRESPGGSYNGGLAFYYNTAAPATSAAQLTRGMRLSSAGHLLVETGSIGVKTAVPAATLHVTAPSSDAVLLQEVARFQSSGRSAVGASLNRGTLISFADSNNESIIGALGGLRENAGASYNGGLGFYTWAGAGLNTNDVNNLSERMRISPSGNVGIGTAAPTQALEVSGITRISKGLFVGNAPSGWSGEPVVVNGASARGSLTLLHSMVGQGQATNGLDLSLVFSNAELNLRESGYLRFMTANTERLRIDATGNIGLGVTAPTAKLHLVSGTASTAPLKFTSGTLLSSPQSGTIEYDGSNYYVTDGGGVRRAIATTSTPGSLSDVSTVSSSGNLSLWPANGNSVIVSATTASTNSQTGALVVKGGLGVAGAANIGGNLNVSGTIHTSSYFSAASLMYLYGTGADYSNASDAYAAGERGFTADLGGSTAWDLLKLKNVSGTQFIVEGGGYTGIGTADPDRRLTIIGDGTAYGDDVMIEATNNNSAGTFAQINLAKSRGTSTSRTTVLAGDTLGALAFRGQNASSLGYGAIVRSIAETDYTVAQSADLRFQTTASGVTADRMIINSLGNVGIGLASPTARLHVSGNSAATAISLVSSTMVLQNANTTAGALNTLMFSNYDGFGNAAISTAQNTAGNVGNNLVLQTKTSSGGAWNTDQLVLNPNGNVGIGVSSPTVKLQVSITDNNSVIFGANDGVNSNFRFLTKYTDGYNYIQAGVSSADTSAKLKFSRAFGSLNLADVRFLSDYASFSGNLGVGTTSATHRLQLNTGNQAMKFDGFSAGNSFTSLLSGSDFGSFIEGPDNGQFVVALRDNDSSDGFRILSGGGNYMTDSVYDTPVFTALATGNVGIGTSSPIDILQVESNATTVLGVNTTGSANTARSLVSFDRAGAQRWDIGVNVNQLGTNDLHFRATQGLNYLMTLTASGNVGVGTVSPLEKFHVDASTSGRMAVASGNIFANTGYGLSLESDTDDGITYLNIHTGAFGANRGEFLIRGGHGASETAATRNLAMFETDTGNVGFGTITPTFGDTNLTTNKWGVLAVAANPTTAGGAAALTLANQKTPLAAGDRVGAVHFVNTNNGTQLYTGFINVSLAGTGGANGFGGQMSFYTKGDNSVNSPQRMLIDQNGYVGINTGAPTQQLHVSGTMQLDGDLYGGKYGGTRGIWRFSTADPNYGIFYTESNPDVISFSPQGGGTTTPSMVVYGNNVGIGINNPTYQLQLSTDSAAKPGTSTWTIASDRRLKDVRAPFTRGLAAIENIQPIYFNYKKDNPVGLPSDKEYVGIIAQEIQKNIPEATHMDKDGYLRVTNDSIIWTMFNAIKELYHKWNSDSQALHEKVSNLEEENKALKSYLCQKDPEAPFCKSKSE